MTKGDHIGGFEHIVLLGLAAFPDGADGMTIYDRVVEATGRDVSVPAVYVTLSRLEKKGLLSSRGPDRRRARKTFRLERRGVTALKEARHDLERLWSHVRIPGIEK